MLVSAVIGWFLLGLGVAYLFGRFVRDVDVQDDADSLVSPVVYVRRGKRARNVTPLHADAQSKRRASGG